MVRSLGPRDPHLPYLLFTTHFQNESSLGLVSSSTGPVEIVTHVHFWTCHNLTGSSALEALDLIQTLPKYLFSLWPATHSLFLFSFHFLSTQLTHSSPSLSHRYTPHHHILHFSGKDLQKTS